MRHRETHRNTGPWAICLVLLLSVVMLLAAASAGLPDAQAASNPERVNVFIGFTATPGQSEEDLVRASGGAIRYTYHLIPAIAAELPEAAISGLSKNPNVTLIEPVVKAYLVNDYQDELDNTWGVKRIGAGGVHSLGAPRFGAGVKVAVIDTGIDYNHSELEGVYVGGYDFAEDDDDPMDVDGHGTHVAGTIAAARDGKGVVGVAPEVELYALKVFPDDPDEGASYADIVAALQWAVENGI